MRSTRVEGRPLLQLYNSFQTPDIEPKNIPKSLTVFSNYI